jgi:hypothetical protein
VESIGSDTNGTYLRLIRRHCDELVTRQECYREVAYTEARDLISFGRWYQHCLEIPSLGP